jgi:hypothetical protein
VLRDGFIASWTWSRKVTAEANQFALVAPSPTLAAEALRIAKRHDGVWRSANKMVRRSADGKESRAAVAVRCDAGDSTCPAYLDREAFKRLRGIAPITVACREVGYQICYAKSPVIQRADASRAIASIAEPMYRSAYGIVGMDILTVPCVGGVRLHVLAAFEPGASDLVLSSPVSLSFNPLINLNVMYEAPGVAARELGPEAWFHAQMSRMIDGRRVRDRHTYGVFFGSAGNSLIKRAAEMTIVGLDAATNEALVTAESKLCAALSIVNDAVACGDKLAAVSAMGYARAYIDDAKTTAVGEHGLLMASLWLRLNEASSLHGLSDAPALGSEHESLMQRIWSLPPLLPRTVQPWQCIERVQIHSMADIVALARWVKDE